MRYCVLIGVSLLGLGMAATAEAQGGPPRQRIYNPAPKISPYLYLSRGSVSGLPSYYAWVRPQLITNQRDHIVDGELRNLQQQQLTIQQNAADSNNPRGGIGPPSTASRYMDYSHYYAPARTPQR